MLKCFISRICRYVDSNFCEHEWILYLFLQSQFVRKQKKKVFKALLNFERNASWREKMLWSDKADGPHYIVSEWCMVGRQKFSTIFMLLWFPIWSHRTVGRSTRSRSSCGRFKLLLSSFPLKLGNTNDSDLYGNFVSCVMKELNKTKFCFTFLHIGILSHTFFGLSFS